MAHLVISLPRFDDAWRHWYPPVEPRLHGVLIGRGNVDRLWRHQGAQPPDAATESGNRVRRN